MLTLGVDRRRRSGGALGQITVGDAVRGKLGFLKSGLGPQVSSALRPAMIQMFPTLGLAWWG